MFEEAIELYRRMLETDPLNAASHYGLGLVLRTVDRLTEAEEAYRQVLELAPQRMLTRAYLSLTLLAQGRCEEALRVATAEPFELFRLWALAIVFHDLGRGAESDAALRDLLEKYGEDGAYQIAEVYGNRGEADAAFDWLERAYAQRDPGLAELKVSLLFRALHADPRWTAFMKRMGFAE
jgi:tetratricopeptide (TPR) repeat protein